LTVGIAGCKKDYLSLENNPNQPSITTPALALPAAEVIAANIYNTAAGYPEYGVWAGYWTTSGNYVPNQAINEYQLTTDSYTGIWTTLYLNLSNWNSLQLLAAKSPNLANYQAISIIMKAFDFQQLVDNFNNVPYSQAFDSKNITPVYDKGADIYHDLGKQLDAAIALITANPNADDPGSNDVIFGGDMTLWQQFANTLKLRLAIRVHTKTPGDPLVAGLASTKSIGYLTSQGVLANPGYSQTNAGSGVSQESPFYGSYGFDVNGNPTGSNAYYRANDFAVKFYQNTNDPRAGAFYAPTSSGGIIKGNVFGDITGNLPNPGTSAIGAGLLQSATQDAVLMSASEADFLQAEGLQSGLITAGPNTFATAQAAYEAGITDSFTALGLTEAQATTYFSQPINNVSYTTSSNKLTAILTQKWAALNGLENLEAYSEYRRTGVPNLPTSVDPSAIGHNLPTRILYPTSELSTNAANLGKEGTINPLTSKIFWAK
jgi:hypothetical protein